MRHIWILLLLVSCAWGAEPPRFEGDVLPLLQARCFVCHSAAARQGGLSVETRDDLLRGGKNGAAVVPKRASDSLILSLISSGKMPMGGEPLAPAEIAVVREWIQAGALQEGETASPTLISATEIFHVMLGAKCFVCHGRRAQEGGLDLRTVESMRRGGKSGPAIVAGHPEESLIIKRIAAQQMPPPETQEQFSVRGLTDDELEKLKSWIAAGAPASSDVPVPAPAFKTEVQSFWSFQPPSHSPVPAAPATYSNPIDAFLLEKLQAKGLTFSKEADRLTLMRRAYLDLIGLPPSPAEADAFQHDQAPGAYERVIDRLLQSPRYGERWARYWLEAAGYADSEGAVSSDNVRPFAWRYRDYVIRALNADKPYDQFLREQLAGDEMFDHRAAKEYTPEQIDKLVATGFLRMAPDSTYSTEQNFLPERFDTVAAEVEVLGSAVLGLTVGCARCHDHKYDPIPQSDYYRLSANLLTAYDPYDWLSPSLTCVGVGAKCDESNTRYLPLLSEKERREVEDFNLPIEKRIADLTTELEAAAVPVREKLLESKLSSLPGGVQADVRAAWKKAEGDRTEIQKYLVQKLEQQLSISPADLAAASETYKMTAEKINGEIQAQRRELKPNPGIRALFDMGGEPTPNRILLRGEVTNSGPLLEPGVLSVLAAPKPYRLERLAHSSGRRMALARWLTQPDHPLTTRVFVNRVWQHHFGVGIVPTPGNFGRTGKAPSHPELLDWLATEFVRQGWSIKKLHRLIMTSAAYRQSSAVSPERQAADPENALLSRYPLRRLDADALWDSMLAIAERLDLTPFGPPDEIEHRDDGEVVAKAEPKGYRRSIYLQVRRSRPVTLLETFDAPQLSPNCLQRPQSTVSSQALQLMNSDMVRDLSRYTAGRIIDVAGEDFARQVERLYRVAFNRRPSTDEQNAALATLQEMSKAWRRQLESERPAEPVERTAQWLALTSLCQTIFNSAEFLYVD